MAGLVSWSVLGVGVPACAQEDPGESGSQRALQPDDTAEGRQLLQGVRDFVFSFDDPAFYWYCRYVRRHAGQGLFEMGPADAPAPWKYLLERPGDYRGEPIVVRGRLRARHAYEVPNRGDLGVLYQCEVSDAGTRAWCAIVVVTDPSDVPIGSDVRAKGFFIKVRSYQTKAGESGAGPLIVAERIEPMEPIELGRAMDDSAETSGATYRWLVPATAALAVSWLILRRTVRRAQPVSRAAAKRAPRGARTPGETDADFNWLLQRPSEDGAASRDDARFGGD